MIKRIGTIVVMILATAAARALADPPERVARLSFLTGTVSYRADTATEWSPAVLNYPFTIGDHVWTDHRGRVELQMGAMAVDLDAVSALSLLNLDHDIVQLRLAQGTAVIRVRELASDESIEIDTPNTAVTLLRPGIYRVDVPPSGDTTTMTVRRGEADVSAGAGSFPVHAMQTATISGLDRPSPALTATLTLDEFEDWAMFRDRRGDAFTAVRYVPRGVVGYEDLDDYGAWRAVAGYGTVWVPHVQVGWAPYRFGHWAWVNPWGWTWIDDAAWGFAPFHYGRWGYVDNLWVWVPGTIVARPVYAPALVAFVGGVNWRVGVRMGEPIGWFPLAPREVFVPAYNVSPAYVTALNRPHVSVTNININVTNITYVNQTVPGAMTVVPRDTFAQARPVAAAVTPLPPEAIRSAPVIGHAAPTQVVPVAVSPAAVAAAPPPSVANRTVVVRTPPPAAIRTVAVRQAAAATTQSRPAPVPPVSSASQVPPASLGAQTPRQSPAARVPPTSATPAAASANQSRVAADPAVAEMSARHAREQAAMEARHAAERADLQTRLAAQAQRAATAAAQAAVRARHAQEQTNLDARQRREHEQMQKRQESERTRHPRQQ